MTTDDSTLKALTDNFVYGSPDKLVEQNLGFVSEVMQLIEGCQHQSGEFYLNSEHPLSLEIAQDLFSNVYTFLEDVHSRLSENQHTADHASFSKAGGDTGAQNQDFEYQRSTQQKVRDITMEGIVRIINNVYHGKENSKLPYSFLENMDPLSVKYDADTGHFADLVLSAILMKEEDWRQVSSPIKKSSPRSMTAGERGLYEKIKGGAQSAALPKSSSHFWKRTSYALLTLGLMGASFLGGNYFTGKDYTFPQNQVSLSQTQDNTILTAAPSSEQNLEACLCHEPTKLIDIPEPLETLTVDSNSINLEDVPLVPISCTEQEDKVTNLTRELTTCQTTCASEKETLSREHSGNLIECQTVRDEYQTQTETAERKLTQCGINLQETSARENEKQRELTTCQTESAAMKSELAEIDQALKR